jgi:uncharacterized membrane protein
MIPVLVGFGVPVKYAMLYYAMTPYLRVVASVVYFGLVRNAKYLIITLFVLIILTASLLVH